MDTTMTAAVESDYSEQRALVVAIVQRVAARRDEVAALTKSRFTQTTAERMARGAASLECDALQAVLIREIETLVERGAARGMGRDAVLADV